MQQICTKGVVFVNPVGYVCGMNDAKSEVKEVSLNDKDCPKIFKILNKVGWKMVMAIEDEGYVNSTFEAIHTLKNGRVYKLTLERIDQD